MSITTDFNKIAELLVVSDVKGCMSVKRLVFKWDFGNSIGHVYITAHELDLELTYRYCKLQKMSITVNNAAQLEYMPTLADLSDSFVTILSEKLER